MEKPGNLGIWILPALSLQNAAPVFSVDAVEHIHKLSVEHHFWQTLGDLKQALPDLV